MNDFKLSTKEILLIGGLAFVLYYMYNKGAFAAKGEKGYQIDLDKPENIPDGSSPGITTAKAKNIAISFRNSMLNNSSSGDIFVDACNSLLTLNDADLLKVHNEYSALFVNEDYKTLRAVLNQEWVFWGSSSQKRKELNERFSQLGI